MSILVGMNGVARVGKDIALAMIRQKLTSAGIPYVSGVLSRELKLRTHAVYGVIKSPEELDSVKDAPYSGFRGKTPREAYIDFSENFLKPRMGYDYWAVFLAMKLKRLAEAKSMVGVVYLVEDLGFPDELTGLQGVLQPTRTLMIHAERPGTPPVEDSRQKVSVTSGEESISLVNPLPMGATPEQYMKKNGRSSLEDFELEVDKIIKRIRNMRS